MRHMDPMSLAQPATRTSGMMIVSHLWNWSSLHLQGAVFSRVAMLILSRLQLTDSLRSKLFDVQASKGTPNFQLLVENVKEKQLGAVISQSPLK